MSQNTKIPPPPRVPQGLIALVNVSRSSAPGSAKPHEPESEGVAAPPPVDEQTRNWRPNSALLEPQTQPEPDSFAQASDEQTTIGSANLHDPRVFRSQPPAALPAEHEGVEIDSEATTIEFVGVLAGFREDETPVSGYPAWVSGEKTALYRPQRSHLTSEESGQLDAERKSNEPLPGPLPPKVIVAPSVLAGLPPDPARAEPTKKFRGQRAVSTKLGCALCLGGAVALALSTAWRYPKALPTAYGALVRVAGVVSGR